jgi:hypothetical protein
MQDVDIEDFILRAISRVEHECKIPITPVLFTEPKDYSVWDYKQYNFIQLNNFPILQIQSFNARYPHTSGLVQYPTEWLAVYNESGQLRMRPTNGSISQFLITNDASLLPLVLGGRADWPQLFEVIYTAGFEPDKIPAIVNELIGIYAALTVLEMMNVVAFIGSYSLNIDGVGQSVSLPSVNWLAARIQGLNEKAAQLTTTIRSAYNRNILVSSLG